MASAENLEFVLTFNGKSSTLLSWPRKRIPRKMRKMLSSETSIASAERNWCSVAPKNPHAQRNRASIPLAARGSPAELHPGRKVCPVACCSFQQQGQDLESFVRQSTRLLLHG